MSSEDILSSRNQRILSFCASDGYSEGMNVSDSELRLQDTQMSHNFVLVSQALVSLLFHLLLL